MTMRDELGVFYTDHEFAALYAMRGRPGEPPWRLALVLVFQFMEGLSDQAAAEAVRSRIDWKYALSLELTDPGFDASVLSEFRQRLLSGGQESRLLDGMLEHLCARHLLRPHSRQRTDSTHVLAAVRALNRSACVGESLRHCLNSLACVAPAWLLAQGDPAWVDRYAKRFEEYRLPTSARERAQLVAQIGEDGRRLLQAVYGPEAPAWLRQLPAVETLRMVWVQHYYAVAPEAAMQWREQTDLPPAGLLIHSPYDVEARYSTKRTTHWVGYKVHLTESCEADRPRLLTHVLTTPATVTDYEVAATIQAELVAKGLPPTEHLLDGGYVDAEFLVTSQHTHQIAVTGPVSEDHSWQARTQTGYDLAAFTLDWANQRAICPHGHVSHKWSETHNAQGTPLINIRFGAADCRTCPGRSQCTRAATQPRELTVRPQAVHEALQQARHQQRTAEFRERYKTRAGIEGTLSQGMRRSDLRHARYIGLAKTHLQHILTAAALNLYRVTEWLAETPLAQTRTPPFVRRLQAAT
jgi:transposase